MHVKFIEKTHMLNTWHIFPPRHFFPLLSPFLSPPHFALLSSPPPPPSYPFLPIRLAAHSFCGTHKNVISFLDRKEILHCERLVETNPTHPRKLITPHRDSDKNSNLAISINTFEKVPIYDDSFKPAILGRKIWLDLFSLHLMHFDNLKFARSTSVGALL